MRPHELTPSAPTARESNRIERTVAIAFPHTSLIGFLCALIAGCTAAPALRTAKQFEAPAASITRDCSVAQGYAPTKPVALNRHVLVSNSEGLIPTDRHQGKFSEAFRTIMLGFTEAVERSPDPARPPRLLFYFNGGLNSQASVEEQAADQVPCMIADGYYPVFFVWDTDGVKSYLEQVTRVWDGQLSDDAWVRWRTPLVVGADIVSGIGRAPVDYMIHGRRFWRALRRQPACSLLVRDLPEKCPKEQRVRFADKTVADSPGLGDEITQAKSKVVAVKDVDAQEREVQQFLYYSVLFPVRLVTTPFAHGLGEAAWENFLRRTRTTVRRSIEFNLDRHVDWNQDEAIDGPSQCPLDFEEDIRDFPRGTGVFARFFETLLHYHLGDWMRRRPSEWRCGPNGDTREPPLTFDEKAEEEKNSKRIEAALKKTKITLIGHSMGAIVINALIERFPDLPYSDIVVMASAASLRETRRVLDRYFEDYPKQSKDTHFYSLMLHPLNDARERQYVGAVPSGSLLMWIDEMYDVPKTPEDKTFGFWPTAKPARRMFGLRAQERMLYRIFSRPHAAVDQPSNPVQHGDFNDDDMCFWRPSFWGVAGTDWEKSYREALPERALQSCTEKHTEL